jgi:hypothetical protein
MKFSDRINNSLNEQGRTKKWLSAKLGITYVALHSKLKNNCFTIAEIYLITNLLSLED